MVHEVFTDDMFRQLAERMRSAGLQQVDIAEKFWRSYRTFA